MEAARIRLVQQPTFARGLMGACARMATEEGISGFYKGLPPILLKQIPYTMAKFVVFEHTAAFLWHHAHKLVSDPSADQLDLNALVYHKAPLSQTTQISISLLSGLAAGLVAATVSQPADTVLSVINKEASNEPMFRAVTNIVKRLGVRQLFLGLGTRLLMVGSFTSVQFAIYDSIKALCGLPSTANSH